jgi:stage V sporulation protein SpoVS
MTVTGRSDQFEVIGRLAPSVRFDEAAAEMQVVGTCARPAATGATVDNDSQSTIRLVVEKTWLAPSPASAHESSLS